MSFTDGKTFLMSQYDSIYKWYCGLCGYFFEQNDQLRWINNKLTFVSSQNKEVSGGNFFVCQKCDTKDVCEKYNSLLQKYEFLWNPDYGVK
jgi:rubrerythrin